MKMILAVINHDDASNVIQHLMQEGYSITKLSTTGSFLRVGNVTILVGVEDDKLDHAIEIIKQFSKSRKQIIPSTSEIGMGLYPSMPIEVTVGGAIIFVLDVSHFEKV